MPVFTLEIPYKKFIKDFKKIGHRIIKSKS